MSNSDLDTLVDLNRYPIHALDQPAGEALVDKYQRALRDEGMCQLPEFLTPPAVTRLVEQSRPLEHLAYFGLTEATPYFTEHDASLPDDHPRNIRTPRELGLVAADQIPRDGGLHQLYECDELRRFLAALLEKKALYRLADPYQKVSLTVMPQGQGHNWHFDDADFTITLMLQKPKQGGEFECVPKLRTPTDENYIGVQSVLQGARDQVRVVRFQPGALMVFRGRYALHRVSPVRGDLIRLVAILTYSTEQNWMGTPKTNELVFGQRIQHEART